MFLKVIDSFFLQSNRLDTLCHEPLDRVESVVSIGLNARDNRAALTLIYPCYFRYALNF
jgi:hypothetical protein